MSHSFPEMSRSFPEMSHPFPEMSHLFPEISHPFPEMSHLFPEISRSFLEMSHSFPEISRSFPEMSHSFPEISLLLLSKSCSFPGRGHLFPEKSGTLSGNGSTFPKTNCSFLTTNCLSTGMKYANMFICSFLFYCLLLKKNKIMGKSYLPSSDPELVAWSDNFDTQVTEHAAEWEIPSADAQELHTLTTSFATLQKQADSPARTSVIVAQKNAARKALVEKIRALVNFRLKNPIITDAQRIAMGLNVRDNKPTSIPVPTTRPELDIDVVDFRRLKVLFHDMGGDNKAKPYGTNGAVIVFAVLDAPPADVNTLSRSVLATRTPHILEFAEEERGKTVYIAICWQNEKGQRGPWSEIENAIVP
jgi:hypothetical protein